MKQGLLASKKIQNQTESVKDTICLKDLSDDERKKLQGLLKIEKMANIGVRLSILPILYILYKKEYFNDNKKASRRMLGVFVSNIVIVGMVDYFANEFMWAGSQEVVMKYSQYSRQYMLKPNELKDVQAIFNGYNNINNNKIISEDDKLY